MFLIQIFIDESILVFPLSFPQVTRKPKLTSDNNVPINDKNCCTILIFLKEN